MSDSKNLSLYVGGGVLLGGFGIVWALAGKVSSGIGYAPVEGISVFAVLYLIAHVTERVTEFVGNLLALLPDSAEERKKEAVRKVRKANSTLNGNPTEEDVTGKSDNEKKVEEARRDIAFFAQGFSIALAALAVNAMNYGLLAHIGVENFSKPVDRVATVLAAAGGTKAIHELVSRMQKAKEAAETTAAA